MGDIVLSIKDLIALVGLVGTIGAIGGSLAVLSYRVKSIEKQLYNSGDGILPRLAMVSDWVVRCKAVCNDFIGGRDGGKDHGAKR